MPRLTSVMLTLVLLAVSAGASAAAVFPGDPVVGPTPALRALDALDLAPDGTGAMVFTMEDGGVDHVFVSRIVNGAWSAPERLDGDLGGPSSQPVVAAGDGGWVVAAFANGGNVYAVTRPSASAGYVRQTIWGSGGASDPAIDLSVNGKGYLAFAAPGAGGHDVRAAFSRDGGPWSLIGAPLDANAGNDAGTGTARPQVAASADGVAIVVWGEGGHVFARRVQGTRPSVVAADALDGLTVEGIQAASADLPVVGTQDDDSFTGVALRAWFGVGGPTLRPRVVFRRLRGSRFETPTAVDGAPFATGQGSVAPRIATVGTGQGLVVGSSDTTFLTTGLLLRFDVEAGTLTQMDSIVQSTAPTFAVPAAATARKLLVAWQVSTDALAPEIHARYYDGTDFQPEQLLSRPELGPTAAVDGLLAAGDDAGDLAIAYVQTVAGAPAIAVSTVDQPPGRFAVKRVSGFLRTDRPVLSWTTSRETWGRYFKVAIDGVQAGVTGGRSFRPPAPLAQGAHAWQVTALDRRGQTYVAPATSIRIDSVPATVQARVSGARRVGATLKLSVRATDAAPPAASGAPVPTSGVKQILLDWGDRSPREAIQHGARHAYLHPGRYALVIVVTDRAGNRSVVRRTLKIVKPPKRHGKKHKPGASPRTR